jgi:hypothetical protein
MIVWHTKFSMRFWLMATLAIDDLILTIAGSTSWSMGGHRYGKIGIPHIGATVRVPSNVLTRQLDRADANVVLTLDDGQQVLGHGMWRVGPLETNGEIVSVWFEGPDVQES